MIKLEFLTGPNSGLVAEYAASELTVGRERPCTITVEADPQMSRHHCSLVHVAGAWFLIDQKSTNGTFLNGVRVSDLPSPLRSGDIVSLGTSAMRIDLTPTGNPANVDSPTLRPPPPKPAFDLDLPSGTRQQPPPLYAPVSPRPKGFKLKEALATYERGVLAAIRDGQITFEEAVELKNVQNRLGLIDDDTHAIRINAVIAIQEYELANSMWDFAASTAAWNNLGVAFSSDPVLAASFYRCFYAQKIARYFQNGSLPQVHTLDLSLPMWSGEICHIAEPANLLEERVISSNNRGGYGGISMRVMKGVRVHLGQSRGQRVSERAVIPVSEGELCITSERVVFLGNPKAFEASWNKIIGVEPYEDGIQFFLRNRQRAPLIRFENPWCSEFASIVCGHYLILAA